MTTSIVSYKCSVCTLVSQDSDHTAFSPSVDEVAKGRPSAVFISSKLGGRGGANPAFWI